MSSPSPRLVLPLRVHMALIAMVLGLAGLLQLGRTSHGYMVVGHHDVGWPGTWCRDSWNYVQPGDNMTPAEAARHEAEFPEAKTEFLLPGIALNALFFFDIWLLSALIAESLARKRFSLARMLAIMVLLAMLFGMMNMGRSL